MLQIKLILSLRMRDLLLWINPSQDLMRSGLEPEGQGEKHEAGGLMSGRVVGGGAQVLWASHQPWS